MTNIVNVTPRLDIEIFRGAALPVSFHDRDAATKVPRSFDATFSMTVKPKGAAPFTLSVGSGVSLSNLEGVFNGRATVLLTNDQSLAVPKGRACTYEITEGPVGSKTVFLAGELVGAD